MLCIQLGRGSWATPLSVAKAANPPPLHPDPLAIAKSKGRAECVKLLEVKNMMECVPLFWYTMEWVLLHDGMCSLM